MTATDTPANAKEIYDAAREEATDDGLGLTPVTDEVFDGLLWGLTFEQANRLFELTSGDDELQGIAASIIRLLAYDDADDAGGV